MSSYTHTHSYAASIDTSDSLPVMQVELPLSVCILVSVVCVAIHDRKAVGKTSGYCNWLMLDSCS